MPRHYTIFIPKTGSPLALIGLFFDPAHKFVNLVSKKTPNLLVMLTIEILQHSFKKREKAFHKKQNLRECKG